MNNLKKATFTTGLAMAMCALSSQHAHAAWSANAAISSDYLWRGVSQTQGQTALSAGAELNSESGFYTSIWTSSVDFSTGASYELDWFAGYRGQFQQIGYDVGYQLYAYPDNDDNINFGELYGVLSYNNVSAAARYLVHASEHTSSSEEMLYLEINGNWPLSDTVNITAHLGSSTGDTVNDWYGEDDYLDYSVGVSYDQLSFLVSKTNLTDDKVKLTVSYSLALP